MSLSEKLSRRIELFREEVEQWQDAHAEAMACLELQDALTFGLWLHQQINSAEAQWYAEVDAGHVPFNEAEETAIAKMYSLWLHPSERLLQEMERFESSGFQVDRAPEFREAIAQAQSCAWQGDVPPEVRQRMESLTADQWESLAKRYPPPPLGSTNRRFRLCERAR